MRKFLWLLFIGVSVVWSNSCKNDLEAMAPYKESVVIYALIDPNDTANYVRVNKVFTGNQDANQVAQIQDSVYFKPEELSVVIEKYFTNNSGVKKLVQTYNFGETYEVPLQPGVFNTNQLIYKSTAPFKSDSVGKFFEYKLVVTNKLSGKQYTATTQLIKNVSPGNTGSLCSGVVGADCFFSYGYNVAIPNAVNSKSNLKYISPINAGICQAKTDFYYHTIMVDSSAVSHVFSSDLGQTYTSSTAGGEVLDFSFSGYGFHSSLAQSVPNEPNMYERVIDSMVYTFSFAGQEYCLYRQINNVSGSFGQSKPIYTNIDNGGYGVFSSRTTLSVTKPAWDCAGAPVQYNVITLTTINAFRDGPLTKCLRFRGPNCAHNGGC